MVSYLPMISTNEDAYDVNSGEKSNSILNQIYYRNGVGGTGSRERF
jgi:hypothetical protein